MPQHVDLKSEVVTVSERLFVNVNDSINLTNDGMRESGTQIVESAVSDICHTWRNITLATPPPFPPAVTAIDYLIRCIDLIVSWRNVCRKREAEKKKHVCTKDTVQ